MYLLDTNHCSYLINNNPQVVATAQSYAQDAFGISIISYGELLYMTEKSERREMNLQVVQAFLTEIDIYLINKEIAEIYSQLKNRIFRQFAPKEKTNAAVSAFRISVLMIMIYGSPQQQFIIILLSSLLTATSLGFSKFTAFHSNPGFNCFI
ncbi:type II toxin-antitoxin system VapC family toxin [Nostoc sp.]|uniref:type II toxin-antitoxin system VapC family toxin n=1 Tax=Nostoc sp. TaxID=1180 RepID=UPI003FA55C72